MSIILFLILFAWFSGGGFRRYRWFYGPRWWGYGPYWNDDPRHYDRYGPTGHRYGPGGFGPRGGYTDGGFGPHGPGFRR